jgi:DNA-binding transcriptional LysR family regulator
MHRRHEKRNIPIELLRALVTIVDTGGFTKAADALDLTQSAISAQISRLGKALGGAIFAKGPGVTLTARGYLVLAYARRMLSVNDELIASAGPHSGPRQLVIGLPPWLGYAHLVEIFQRCLGDLTREQLSFRCDRSERLIGDLNLGSIDLAILCDVIEPPRPAVAEWLEKRVWVKSPRLELVPGAPIPLVSWPGSNLDHIAIEAFQKAGMNYVTAFSAPDVSCRLAAVAAGLGILVVNARMVTPEMEVIHEGLPALPDNRSGLFAREGLDLSRVGPVLQSLREAAAPQRLTEVSALNAAIKQSPQRGRTRATPLRRAG